MRLPDEDVDPTIITGFGDGTVPEYSASDRLVSRDGDIVRVTTDQSEHLAILNSVEVKVLLEAWLTDIGFSTHARKRTPPVPVSSPPKEKRADRPLLIPIPSAPDRWKESENDEIIAENRIRLAAWGGSAEEFLQELRELPTTFAKLTAFVSASACLEDNKPARLLALVEATEQAVTLQNFRIAQNIATYAANAGAEVTIADFGIGNFEILLWKLSSLKGELRLDPYLPRATVTTTSVRSYMELLGGAAS